MDVPTAILFGLRPREWNQDKLFGRTINLVTEGFLRRELSYGLSVSDAYGIDR